MSSKPHKTSRNPVQKICAWFWVLPLSQNHKYTDLPVTSSGHFLRGNWDAISWPTVLILPQIKLNSQLSHGQHAKVLYFGMVYLVPPCGKHFPTPCTENNLVHCSITSVHSVMSDSLRPHEPQHTRTPCPSPTPRVYPNSCPVSDAIQPSHPLSSPSPAAFKLPQYQGLLNWLSFLHKVDKVLEPQLQHQSFEWTPRTDLL